MSAVPELPPRLVGLAAGRELLAELTRGAPLPVNVGRLSRQEFEYTGAAVFGDVPIRGRKAGGRWLVDETEIRAAGEVLARPVDLRDLVPLPRPRGDVPVIPPGDWCRRMHYAVTGRDYPGETAAEVARNCEFQTLAGVSFLDLVVRVGGRWAVPRGYVELLKRWRRVESGLLSAARLCEQCGADGGPRYWRQGWRVATAAGYATLCPACRVEGAAPYGGELSGRIYGKRLPVAPGRYVCRLCPERAALWDHCHDHGYVRGPLCWSCNTSEHSWLHSGAALAYLHACPGCREGDTLPARHLSTLAREHAERVYRHGRCTRYPRVDYVPPETVDAARPVVLVLACGHHGEAWQEALPYPELLTLARRHMRQAGKAG